MSAPMILTETGHVSYMRILKNGVEVYSDDKCVAADAWVDGETNTIVLSGFGRVTHKSEFHSEETFETNLTDAKLTAYRIDCIHAIRANPNTELELIRYKDALLPWESVIGNFMTPEGVLRLWCPEGIAS